MPLTIDTIRFPEYLPMPTLEQARTWYAPTNDPVHGFDHILRVCHMAEKLACAEGADLEIVRAAALLHDAEGAANAETRRAHQHAAADFAAKTLSAEGWPAERIAAVQHCIRTHRFREESERPKSIEAQVLFDADKLDAIGAIGAVRAISYAVRAQQPMFAPPSAQFVATLQKEPGEPHTPYHEFLFKLCKLKDRMFTATGKKLAEQRHQVLVEFFAQLQRELEAEA